MILESKLEVALFALVVRNRKLALCQLKPTMQPLQYTEFNGWSPQMEYFLQSAVLYRDPTADMLFTIALVKYSCCEMQCTRKMPGLHFMCA